MKIPQGAPTTSFGIPENLRPEVLLKDRRKVEEDARVEHAPPELADEGFAVKQEKVEAPPTPVERLAKMGIDFTTDDYSRIFYQGFVEKKIKAGYDPVAKKAIYATVRTLTPGEYDALDECLAEETKGISITVSGMEARRSAWMAAFVIMALNDRPFVKTVTKEDPDTRDTVVDKKATAILRKKFISELNVHTVNQILDSYRLFDVNVKLIMGDPESAFLERP